MLVFVHLLRADCLIDTQARAISIVSLLVFTVRRYAGAVCAMTRVCPSQTAVLSKRLNGWIYSSYKIRVSSTIRVLPCGSLALTVNLADFYRRRKE